MQAEGHLCAVHAQADKSLMETDNVRVCQHDIILKLIHIACHCRRLSCIDFASLYDSRLHGARQKMGIPVPCIYAPLETSRQHIRLVKLQPGVLQDDIFCNLRTVNLSEQPRFEALSYVWGDPEITLPIVVDSYTIKVTTNLYSALQHLRQPSEPRWVWIDAICINQNDVREKTHQVNLMREIYRSAAQGLVWLGDFQLEGLTEVQAEDAFNIIRMIASSSYEINSLLAQPDDTALFEQSSLALQCMMRNPWWSRIWTAQEVVFPPWTTVIWGSVTIPWSSFEKAAAILARHRENGVAYVSKLPFALQGHQFTGPVHGIMYMRKSHDQEPLDIFWRFRYRVASDPRDKIFFMPASLTGRLQASDYALDTAELYKRVTLDYIESNKSLVCMIGRRGETHVCQNVPSWAIDWVRPPDLRQQTSRYWDHAFRYPWFCCDNELALSMHRQHGNSSISLDGIYIDTITILGQATFLKEDTVDNDLSVEDLRATIKHWLQIANPCQPSDGMYIGGGTWQDAFWRTLIGDLITSDAQPQRKAEPADHESFIAFCNPDSPDPESSDLYDSLRSFLINQSLVITQQGYMGIGPWNSEVGDELWVLFGGRVPFVLRPYTTCDLNESLKSYTLVGDCYVHGCMQGQLMTRLKDRTQTAFLY